LLVILLSPHPEATACPSTRKCYELRNVPELITLPLFSPFGLVVESIKEFGGASHGIKALVEFDPPIGEFQWH